MLKFSILLYVSYTRYVTSLNPCIVYVTCLASCQPFDFLKRNLALADALHDSPLLWLLSWRRTSIVYVMCLASNRFLKKEFGSRGCTRGQLKAFLKKWNYCRLPRLHSSQVKKFFDMSTSCLDRALNRFLKREFGSRGCTPGQLKASIMRFSKKGIRLPRL